MRTVISIQYYSTTARKIPILIVLGLGNLGLCVGFRVRTALAVVMDRNLGGRIRHKSCFPILYILHCLSSFRSQFMETAGYR